MEVNEEMLQSAMKKAAEVGLLPRFLIGELTYLQNWEAIQAVIQAALDAVPNVKIEALADTGHNQGE